jgi:signal transduction histidine kinase
LAPVRTIVKFFGVLCIEKPTGKDYESLENMEQVKVFTGLCACVLERFELEVVSDRLIISEEQNRIANEIHDGVLQRLFSISCGLFSLSKRLTQIEMG